MSNLSRQLQSCRRQLPSLLLPALFLLLLSARAQSTRLGLGSIPYRDSSGTGVTFRVWAPNATAVFVPGQFNNWSTTATPLHKEVPNGFWNGHWSADVPSASVGHEYKYYLHHSGGTVWRRDPRSRKVVNSGGNSIIYDPAAFNWSGDAFTPPPLHDLVIYELHVGTFNDPNPSDSQPGRFTDAINRLGHLKNLGVNALELLPINEFPGDRSWGYNPADLFAVENPAYGGPDSFKTFVKAAHAQGFAVLLDVVHNHYGPSDLDLWNFDGWSGNNSVGGGGIYFYQSDVEFQVTPWGNTRPNYNSTPVRQFIRDHFRMWLEEYHLDGFRWDTPGVMLQASDGRNIPAAATLITEINSLIHSSPSGPKISIAEDRLGYGFDSAWDTTYPHTLTPILTQPLDANRNLSTLTNALATSLRYGGAASPRRVTFLESHDVVGDLNSGQRLVTAIDPASPASFRARKLSLLGAALMFTTPGIPMLFQGQEMLENQPFSDRRPVDWSKTNTHHRIVRAWRDLIHARRNLSGGTPGLQGDRLSFLLVDHTQKLLAYRRWHNDQPTLDTVIIANLSSLPRTNTISFPRAGTWHTYFNSDSTSYSTDFKNLGQETVLATPGARVIIGPYSLQILSQRPLTPTLTIQKTSPNLQLSWPATYQNWTLQQSSDLTTWTTIQTTTNQLEFATPTPPPSIASSNDLTHPQKTLPSITLSPVSSSPHLHTPSTTLLCPGPRSIYA